MKFCTKCGKELGDGAVICPNCGTPVADANVNQNPNVNNYVNPTPYANPYPQQVPEGSGLAVCALVFAFLAPLVGLILGIIGVCKYKTQKLKNMCIAAIPVSVVVWIIGMVAVFSSLSAINW